MSGDFGRSILWAYSCNGLFVIYYTAMRLEYLIWNWATFKQFDWSDIALALLAGTRFDIAVVFALSALPFLLALCPVPRRMRRRRFRVVAALFFGLQLPFIVLNTVDIELANIVGRRATRDTLLLLREVQGKFLSFALTYWTVWIINTVLLFGLFAAFLWLTRRRGWPEELVATPAGTGAGRRRALARFGRATGLGVLVVLTYVVAVRGGIQAKPLTFAHANIFPAGKLNNLVLNSSFTLLQSFQTSSLDDLDYFRDRSEMFSLLNGRLPGVAPLWTQERRQPQNVVLLILESFGQEYMGAVNGARGFTPFLDSLAARGLFFSHNYANGRRTIEALPSILAGLPSLMTEALISSQYANVPIDALGAVLGRRGYRTAFFHGGHNGTMYLNQFAKMAGFQEYYGFNEYPSAERDDDGNWGVYDAPFLQFMNQKASSFKEPFFISFFSLTSHHPYPVPTEFKDKFPKGSQQILESLGYADEALRQFFTEAEKQAWYPNTLFVITADHTHQPYLNYYPGEVGRYRVPLIFFHPSGEWPPVDTAQITQHVDIAPSILDFLGIEQGAALLFGRSVFRSGERYATIFAGQDYYLLDRAWNLRFRRPNTWQVFNAVKDPAFQVPLRRVPKRARTQKARLQATLQYFQNGLRDNNLLVPNLPLANRSKQVETSPGAGR